MEATARFPNTGYPNSVVNIAINVRPVCELMSIYAKHLTEFELDPDWILSTALQCVLDEESEQECVAYEDLQSPGEFLEFSILQLMIDEAIKCISQSLPENLTPADLMRLSYGFYGKEKVFLYLTADYEYE